MITKARDLELHGTYATQVLTKVLNATLMRPIDYRFTWYWTFRCTLRIGVTTGGTVGARTRFADRGRS